MAHKNNIQNLIPNSERTPEELQAMRRNGGIKSGQVRREKKKLKEQMELLLSLPLAEGKNKKLLKKLGLNEEEIDNKMAINYALFTQAMKGNVKAYKLIQETIGEKPKEEGASSDSINNNMVNIANLINNPKKVRTEEDLYNE